LYPNDPAHIYQHLFEILSDGLIVNDTETGLVLEANPAACDLHGYPEGGFVGLHPTMYIHLDDTSQWATWVVAAEAGESFSGTIVHLRQDGSPFVAEVRGRAGIYEGRPCIISSIRDVSGRVQAERQLRQQVVNHAREQATLLEISQILASTLELEPTVILDQLQVIVQYTQATLFVLKDLTLRTIAVRGCDRLEKAMPFGIEIERTDALVMLFNGHQSQRIANVWQENDQTAEFLRSLLAQQMGILLEGMHSWMWVPLVVKGRMIGGIGITHVELDKFTVHDANLALTLANQAAIALMNTQLYQQAQMLAALEERQRLAQNLHDAVNQSLFSASMIAEVLPRLWDKNVDEGKEALQDLRRLIRGALAEMRGLLAELRPVVLTDTDLGDLLTQLGDALTGRINVPVKMTVMGKDFLSADVRVVFYRLCQEALNNIAKHANPSRVEISLICQDGTIEMKISDNGRGFDPTKVRAGHYGLSMMDERAKEIGATLTVTSLPGQGTEILVHWRGRTTIEKT
jgi:PAS domain S-box-containing protein